MSKKMKAALAGLAFVAGCEIGIAIELMKMIPGGLRLPLTEMEPQNAEKLIKAMREYGIQF